MPKKVYEPLTPPTPQEVTAWRTEHSYTQAGLAATLGINIRTVQRWETGEYDRPLWLALALKGIRTKRPRKRT